MKLINLVKELQAQGVDIKYRVRKDGGILITQVSGMRFKAAEGNRFVRTMTGDLLSEEQLKQRKRIKPPKNISPAGRKKPPIPDDVKRDIQRLQRLYRKDKKRGKPTIANYRYNVKEYGEEKAREMLKQSEYYLKDIAYTGNILSLIARLEVIATNVETSGEDATPIKNCAEETRQYMKTSRDKFSNDKLDWLIALVYDLEKAWNAYQQGMDTDYPDAASIINEFAQNYMITLNA